MSKITVNIKCSNEAKFSVTIVDNATVTALKEAIAAELEKTSSPTPPSGQRLIFAGRVLKDEEVLTTYKVIEGSTLHLVRSKPAGSSSTPSTTTATPSTTTSTTSPTGTTPAAPAPTPTTPAPNANPWAALLGAGLPQGNPTPFAGAGSPGAGLGAGGLNGPMDPNVMASLLSNPAVASSVASMMSNPAIMDSLIASNPQMANAFTPQMRSMMQSEEFRRMMANPEFIRSMMQMAPLMGGGFNPFGAGGYGGAPGATPGADAGAGATAGAGANPMNPTGAAGFDPALLSLLMGGLPPARPPPPANPEEAYAEQLRQLQDMGFYDASENIRALNATGGNVSAAVEWLFNHPPGHSGCLKMKSTASSSSRLGRIYDRETKDFLITLYGKKEFQAWEKDIRHALERNGHAWVIDESNAEKSERDVQMHVRKFILSTLRKSSKKRFSQYSTAFDLFSALRNTYCGDLESDRNDQGGSVKCTKNSFLVQVETGQANPDVAANSPFALLSPEVAEEIAFWLSLQDLTTLSRLKNRMIQRLFGRPRFAFATGNLSFVTSGGGTLFEIALETSEPEVEFAAIADAGLNLNPLSSSYLPPLHYIASRGPSTKYLTCVRWVVENGGARVDLKDAYGRTPLHKVCECGGENRLYPPERRNRKFFLYDEDELTPAEKKELFNDATFQIAEYLIKNGSNVNERDARGMTPLHYAASNGLTNVVEILLESGAEVDPLDKDGFTPLRYAKCVTWGNFVARVLRQHNASEALAGDVQPDHIELPWHDWPSHASSSQELFSEDGNSGLQ
ncbi:hypothetical protein HDU96_004837 [Phlyctochytrium bullatum]|nr:hypothetical protein HDU96_004837 [Phlyctochytrium bullatum]